MATRKKAPSPPKPAVKTSSTKRRPKAAAAASKRKPTPAEQGSSAKRRHPPAAAASGARGKPRPITPPRAATPFSVRAIVDLGIILERIRPSIPRNPQYTLRRPDDLAAATLVTHNLRVEPGPTPQLVRSNPAAESYLLLVLPPQSFGEEAFLDATGTEKNESAEVSSAPGYPKKNSPAPGQPAEPTGPLPAARMRMSGPSRIAVTMPAGVDAIDFTFAGVLKACRTWPLRLDAAAAPEPTVRPDLIAAAPLDKGWLQSVVASAGWAALNRSIETELAASGGAPLLKTLHDAGANIGRRTVAALRSGPTAASGRELERALISGAEALSARFPDLREATTRQTALAAMALAATETVASSRLGFEIAAEALTHLPIFPIVLAPHAPGASVTAIELPYRLMVSPIESARFTHSDLPVERQDRTELWHSRLSGQPAKPGADAPSKIRALWSPDYAIALEEILKLLSPLNPYRMSLDPLDRKMLVQLMAGYNERTALRRPYTPRPSRVQRLMLSALGGLLDAEGNWSPSRPAGVGLEQWRHLASLGRDHYVRVVYAGFLMPFGHAAALIKVTERKFETGAMGSQTGRAALLRQRFFIVVREPVKAFSGTGHAFGGRNFPFIQVQIVTRVTPNLLAPDHPGKAPLMAEAGTLKIYDAVPPRAAFWPMLAPGADFRFEVDATDLAGNRVSFAMPLAFMGVEANQARAAAVRASYNSAEATRRTAPTAGASVCFAPVTPGVEGDPRLPAASLLFASAAVSGISLERPQFYPEIESAQVGIQSVQRLLGREAAVGVKYPDVYKQGGFGGANPGEVFLQTLADFALEFGESGSQAKSDALGALATPGMAIQGLSRIMGPVGDLAQVAGNKFDPAKFFKDAKILGGIPLASLLDVVTALAGSNVPRMLSRDLPDRFEASFTWQTAIKKSDPLGLFVPGAGGKTTRLDMRGVVSAPAGNPAAATFEALATLDNFKVNLFGFITIWFDLLRFHAKRGAKPDITCELHPGNDTILFGGPLEFVNQLRELIPSNGFSDPPSLSVTPSGISASYSLTLPAVQVGIFALSNASLGAGFVLPFDARPLSVRFNFSERQSPFSLTVSLFGGGGFFAIGIGTEGVKEIEAALEFGAAVSINLGVASGGVEVKAGVYFHWLQVDSSGGTVELTGYVRLHGELSILGLISVSLTFNLQLSYLKDQPAKKSTVWGEATLTVEIEILFFSAEVSVKCRREFAGSESDPRFVDFIPNETVWLQYCNAFAQEE